MIPMRARTCAEEGDELADPDDGEALHAGGASGLDFGFEGCARLSGVGCLIWALGGRHDVKVDLLGPFKFCLVTGQWAFLCAKGFLSVVLLMLFAWPPWCNGSIQDCGSFGRGSIPRGGPPS